MNAFSNVITLRPDFAEAQANLAGALANLGDFPAAAAHYREALRLEPSGELARGGLKKLLTEHPELR